MDALQFDIRDARGDDLNFIYATWLESFRYDSYFGKSHRNTIFFNDYRKVVDRLLDRSSVLVACVKDEPGTILGYLVHEPDQLHYVFVKGAFRRLGIGRGLFDKAFPGQHVIEFTHKTFSAIPILEKTSRLNFRGTALLKQGES